MTRGSLGEFEHLILLAVYRLGAEAYGVPIIREVEERTGRTVTQAAAYLTLRRLEDKGLVKSKLAVVALVLSVAGVYGLISYSVAQRTQEMGIRMALGAREGSVLLLVLLQGAALTGMGILVGILSAAAVARGMSLWLFGVSPFDAASFGTAIAVLLSSSVAASYFPARRVAQLDPLKVLRCE